MALSRTVRKDIIKDVIDALRKLYQEDETRTRDSSEDLALQLVDRVNLSRHLPQPPDYRKVLVLDKKTKTQSFRKRY